MKINVKATGLDLTPSLKVYIESKIGSLAKFVKRFDMTGEAEVWLEVARTTRHHHKGDVFEAEADIRLPKKILRAVHDDVDIRIAIDKLRSKLRLEIEKYKTRTNRRPVRGTK